MKTLNKLTRIVSFLDFFILCVILCFILFLFGTFDNFTKAVLYFFSLLYCICRIFLFCLHGNQITEEVHVGTNLKIIVHKIYFRFFSVQNYLQHYSILIGITGHTKKEPISRFYFYKYSHLFLL